jgi:hypothetical protein
VAVSGDTVVVGAPYEDSSAVGVNGNQADNSASYSGAAYVFVRSGGVWSQQAYLKASNTETEDLFGQSVAVSSDTVVVGAPGEDSSAVGVNGNQADNSALSAGAVYLFVPQTALTVNSSITRSGNSFTLTVTIRNEGPANAGSFTWSCQASSGAVCPAGSGSGSISQTLATFPPNSQLIYQASGSILNPFERVFSLVTLITPSGVINSGASTTPVGELTLTALPLIYKNSIPGQP